MEYEVYTGMKTEQVYSGPSLNQTVALPIESLEGNAKNILRQNSHIAQCTDDNDIVGKRLQLGGTRVVCDLPDTERKHIHLGCTKPISNDYINIQQAKENLSKQTYDDDIVSKTLLSEKYNQKDEKTNTDSRSRLSISEKLTEYIINLSKCKTAEEFIPEFEKLVHLPLDLPVVDQVRIPDAESLTYVLKRLSAVHISLQRDNFGQHFLYRHHQVIIKLSNLQYRIYESSGDFNNIFRGEYIAHFRTDDKYFTDLQKYDYHTGVYLCLHPKMFHSDDIDIQKMHIRAEKCSKLEDYYSFSSLNCENVATYIFTGRGVSHQLDNMTQYQWAACDSLDSVAYTNANVFILMINFIILFITVLLSGWETLSRDLMATVGLLCELLVLEYYWQKEQVFTSERMKEIKHSRRLMIRYGGSFILRFAIHNSSCMTVPLNCLLLVALPIVFGFLFDIFMKFCRYQIKR